MFIPQFTSSKKLDYTLIIISLLLLFYVMGYTDSKRKQHKIRKRAKEAEKQWKQEDQLFEQEMQLTHHEEVFEKLDKRVAALEASTSKS